MFNKKGKRFKTIYEEGSIYYSRIIQDTVTGVNYLYSGSGSAGGITPLLDKNGQVVVTTIEDWYEDKIDRTHQWIKVPKKL